MRTVQTFTLAEAVKILRVDLPTTANALKSAFRRRSREVHPDHSVAVDAKDGFVATEGWLDVSSRTAADVARELADAPLAALLYTDIARDGTQVGPNFEATEELARSAAHPVLASGGVGTLDHLRKLARLRNVAAAIVGRALYEKAFTIEEGVAACR